jgi:hypothetical protein
MKRIARSTQPDDGGVRPNDHGIVSRIEKLEQDVTVMKIDIGIIKATCATKTDLAELVAIVEAGSAVNLWFVGAVFLGQMLPGLLKLIEAHM